MYLVTALVRCSCKLEWKRKDSPGLVLKILKQHEIELEVEDKVSVL
jgi:hypothetical protein